MKTPEYYLDEVAKEKGYENWNRLMYSMGRQAIILFVKEAMLRHSKEACEEQKKLCAEEAKSWISYDEVLERSYVDKQSILNAKSPIE